MYSSLQNVCSIIIFTSFVDRIPIENVRLWINALFAIIVFALQMLWVHTNPIELTPAGSKRLPTPVNNVIRRTRTQRTLGVQCPAQQLLPTGEWIAIVLVLGHAQMSDLRINLREIAFTSSSSHQIVSSQTYACWIWRVAPLRRLDLRGGFGSNRTISAIRTRDLQVQECIIIYTNVMQSHSEIQFRPFLHIVQLTLLVLVFSCG